jgi:hypothetical protein
MADLDADNIKVVESSAQTERRETGARARSEKFEGAYFSDIRRGKGRRHS